MAYLAEFTSWNNAVKRIKLPWRPNNEKIAISTPIVEEVFQLGHYHYKSCPNDTPIRYTSHDCACSDNIEKHNKYLINKSMDSAGRILDQSTRSISLLTVKDDSEDNAASRKHARDTPGPAQDAAKKQRKQPKEPGSTLEQLLGKQKAVLEGCGELEHRLWQHLAHRQEKLLGHLDSLRVLYDQLAHFDTLSLSVDDPEPKKRILEAEQVEHTKRQKAKESVESKPTPKKDRGKKGTKEEAVKYTPFDNSRFDSNLAMHMAAQCAAEFSHDPITRARAGQPYKILGFHHESPLHFLKLAFASGAALHLRLSRPEPNQVA